MADHGMARMQEILSSYYGMQDKETSEESLRNIDAQGFSPDLYIKELLTTSGLNDLFQRDDQLIKEIKELDTNMQMLVYENYNKFISATDTIRKMKNNVASMESEVGKVVSSMDVITEKSESINVALAPHRSKVEKLIGVRRLLKRLEFIFELPQRLNAAVKQEEFGKATKFFLIAQRILDRYQHIASFKTIQVEAEKIMLSLRLSLIKKLSNDKLPSAEVCEAITLLKQLDACTDDLRQQFLDWHQVYFTKQLQQLKTQPQEAVMVFLRRINTGFLTELSHVFQVYKTHFLPTFATNSKVNLYDDPLFPFAKDIFAGYVEVCSVQFCRHHQEMGDDPEHEAEAEDEAEEAGEYYVLMSVLRKFIEGVNDIDTIIPQCNLSEGAVQVIATAVRFQIECNFSSLRKDTVECLMHSHTQIKTLVSNQQQQQQQQRDSFKSSVTSLEVAQQMHRTLLGSAQAVLRQMQPLVQTGATLLPEMSSIFSDLVQTQFHHFLQWLNDTFLLYTEPRRAFAKGRARTHSATEVEEIELPWLEPSPHFSLFLSYLCRQLSNEGIADCLQVLIECLPRMETFDKVGNRARFASMGSVDVANMIQVTRETSLALLHQVAQFYGHQLCRILKQGMRSTNWLDVEEPRSVQEVAEKLVEETYRIAGEIATALGDENFTISRTGSRDFRRRSGALRSRGGGGSLSAGTGTGTGIGGGTGSGGTNLQLDVERIFAKRIQIYGKVELTTESFVLYLLKMVFKCYGELVRTHSFSKGGIQQIQVNAEFFRTATAHLILEPQELESLLSDVLSNARERCTEDVLMEQSVVVAIVSTRIAVVLPGRR